MALYKDLQLLKEELKKLEDDKPGNMFGHWAKSLKTKSIKGKIMDIENKLQRKKKN